MAGLILNNNAVIEWEHQDDSSAYNNPIGVTTGANSFIISPSPFTIPIPADRWSVPEFKEYPEINMEINKPYLDFDNKKERFQWKGDTAKTIIIDKSLLEKVGFLEVEKLEVGKTVFLKNLVIKIETIFDSYFEIISVEISYVGETW